MIKQLLILKHWIKFNTATPKPVPDGPYNPEEDMIGAVVQLINDHKKQEYEVLRSGPISKGPMGQFLPSRTFLCRKPMYGYEGQHYDYWWFRKDSLLFIR